MSLNIALQMDPIHKVDPEKDSTYLLAKEALKRGYHVYYYPPSALILQDGIVLATMQALSSIAPSITLSAKKVRPLNEMDIILLRQDPPFDMGYITSTYLLDLLPSSTLVLNNPTAVRRNPEKLLVCQFPELMPSTVVTEDYTAIAAFLETQKRIILKPLYSCGGKDIFYITSPTMLKKTYQTLYGTYKTALVAQRFIERVYEGDKRIILFNGEAVGAVLRIPQEGDFKANFHCGGQPQATHITTEDQVICDTIAPTLKAQGLFFAGIDVIGGKLTEINVTSPTGLQEINRLNKVNLEKIFWDKIVDMRKVNILLRSR